jgi:hypothetical protein
MASKSSTQWVRRPGDIRTLKDYQHASRLYIDDDFRLAPKVKFLYYAVFGINPNININNSFLDRHKLELNYLVKQMDLPKFTINTTNLNQYNRKTTAYTRITYEPLNFKFHDDNVGVSNSLWALYYGYYINDRYNSTTAYKRTTYANKNKFPYRYGLDSEASDAGESFFNSIQLFTLSRNKFFSYTLCNPVITSWQHDTMDQSQGNGIVENSLTVAYDAVLYNTGDVSLDNPPGFAKLHYDNTPGPIAPSYNGTQTFEDLYRTSPLDNVQNFISQINETIRSYENLVGNRSAYGANQPDLTANALAEEQVITGLLNYMLRKSSSNSTELTQATEYQTSQAVDTPPISKKLKQQQALSDHRGDTNQYTDAYSSDFEEATNNSQKAAEFTRESQYFNNQKTPPIDATSGSVDVTSVNVNGRTVSNKNYTNGNSIVEKQVYVDNTQELLTNNYNPDLPQTPFD